MQEEEMTKVIYTFNKQKTKPIKTLRVNRGVDAKNLELRVEDGVLEYRREGSTQWNELTDLELEITTITDEALSDKEDLTNKVVAIDAESTDDEYPSAKLMFDQLALKEDLTNKVVAVDAESTDDEYPSAKAVYDELLGKMDLSLTAPASATAPGTPGQTVITGGYLYTCTAVDTWERVAMVTETWV